MAAITWGTTGTTLKLLGATAGTAPLLVGFSRMLVAAPLLAAGAAAAERGIRVRGRGFLAAGLCIGLYQAAYFSAVPRAGVAATAVLAICSAPLIIAALSAVFLGERLTRRTAVALAAGVSGTGLLVGGASLSGGPEFFLGAALALAAGVCYAVYAVVTRHSLRGTPPLGLAAVTFGTAAVVMSPALLLHPDVGGLLQHGWPLVLYLGAVPTALAYALYTTGLRTATATAASIVALFEPLTATVLGLVLFRESLGAAGLLGVVLLIGAVAMLATQPDQAPTAVEA